MIYLNGDTIAPVYTKDTPAPTPITDNVGKMVTGQKFDIITSDETSLWYVSGYGPFTARVQENVVRFIMPEVTGIPNGWMTYGTNLEEVRVPKVTNFEGAFLSINKAYADSYRSTKLTSWDDQITISDNISMIGELCFCGTDFDKMVFGHVSNVKLAFAPNNTKLQMVKFNSVGTFQLGARSSSGTTYTNTGSFNGNGLMKILDLGDVTAITGTIMCFLNCVSMRALVIRKTDAMTTLASATPLNWLKNNVPDWRIYVPDDLVDTYKANATWANFTDLILPLSEYNEQAILGGN